MIGGGRIAAVLLRHQSHALGDAVPVVFGSKADFVVCAVI